MRRVILRGLLTRKLRTVLTSLAILLGVAMIAGTFVLTDQIDAAFGDIFESANKGSDVVLTKERTFDTQSGAAAPLPEPLVAKVRAAPGVDKADGVLGGTGVLVADGKVIKGTGGAPSLVFSKTEPPFNTNTYVEGRAPERTGELALIEQTADDHHLCVGQHVVFASASGQHPVTVVGVFRFANKASIGGAI